MISSNLFDCFKYDQFHIRSVALKSLHVDRLWSDYMNKHYGDIFSGNKRRGRYSKEKEVEKKKDHASTKRTAHRTTREALEKLEQCRSCKDIELCFKLNTLAILEKIEMYAKRIYENK